jgi:hypothetical protein
MVFKHSTCERPLPMADGLNHYTSNVGRCVEMPALPWATVLPGIVGRDVDRSGRRTAVFVPR